FHCRLARPCVAVSLCKTLIPTLPLVEGWHQYSPFSLTNKATGQCLVRRLNRCLDLRWTTGNRLMVTSTKKCLGAQGKSVGSEVNQYDCDEKTFLQRWECKNGTLLALIGQPLYMQVKADGTVALSKTIGPNNQITITDTLGWTSYNERLCPPELYSIGGNAFGKICMFPFLYKDRWFGECTTFDAKTKRSWCAVETKFEHEQWGYCPSSCETTKGGGNTQRLAVCSTCDYSSKEHSFTGWHEPMQMGYHLT
uniref:Fibronectin type-II domain-containing protein n=1 Tax=Oryzias melastigma TaxID=30732 RepID=A0A3B3BYF1_ORYME